MTPLMGGDGLTHAVAQGSVSVSGSSSTGQAESYSQGVPTAGRIPNGATVEAEAPPGDFGANGGTLTLELRNPDFKTAVRVADVINQYTRDHYRVSAAHEQDLHRVALICPRGVSVTRFMASIGDLLIEPDTPARVIIDERTGTVVIGQDVQISTVAVTHGSLTVRITETPVASQPAPLSNGKTVVLPNTSIDSQPRQGSEPDRSQANRHHRHPPGDQVRRGVAGRTRLPVARGSAVAPTPSLTARHKLGGSG